MPEVKILAVDDQEFNLDLIELAFMESTEVKIVRAVNGEEALNVLRNDPDYHVILLDLAMPVMNGFEALQHIKTHPLWSQIPTIVVTANAEEKNRALREGASDFLSKPIDVEELKLRTFNYAKIKEYQDNLADMNHLLEEKVQKRTAQLQEALLFAKKTEYEISARLGKASEYRDLETGMHIKRMSHYSAKLAELAGLCSEEVELILYASPLHDIGKVGIPDRILLKPGRFSVEEFEIMKLHTSIGAKMLETDGSYPVIDAGRIIALQHHEKIDGSGYPNGLKGDDIHIHARIVSIADVFDALSSERVYKKAFSIDQTIDIIREGRGSHFDAQLVDLLIDHLDLFLEIREAFPDEEAVPSIMNLIDQIQ
ncbi:HD domain-containing phosphohydrolase [Sulfuricurvum sp.]|uniref:HD domain-containing phosphohydrolase n=1 Tax=Sulfuricurvum sp. TaxID=2025608 RepID=UPI002616C58E|nr:HD domain-containing phosphohydrolase [Sulfuricurvum sp.]MDD2267811.1 response regulator [Sulfuricurvum sp.]MDD2783501.1 response regulator [Sulfuricurvum sp.]